MSSNDLSTQFFPPLLKRISIVFFAVLFVGIVLIAYFSPQSHLQKDHALNHHEAQPTATIAPPSGKTLAQTTTTPTPTATPDHHSSTAPESITSEVDTVPPAITPITTTAPTPNQTETSKTACPGNSKPNIKGIIINNQKYYYKKGMQHYFLIGTIIPVNKWFCNENEAKSDGWLQAPLNIFKLIL